MRLFQLGEFTLHGGDKSFFKIDCDALSDADWECLAYMIAVKSAPFRDVVGIPRGGTKLAHAMAKYATPDNDGLPVLVVDDVWTTGGSMKNALGPDNIGWVVFARNPIDDRRVNALFTMGR